METAAECVDERYGKCVCVSAVRSGATSLDLILGYMLKFEIPFVNLCIDGAYYYGVHGL